MEGNRCAVCNKSSSITSSALQKYITILSEDWKNFEEELGTCKGCDDLLNSAADGKERIEVVTNEVKKLEGKLQQKLEELKVTCVSVLGELEEIQEGIYGGRKDGVANQDELYFGTVKVTKELKEKLAEVKLKQIQLNGIEESKIPPEGCSGSESGGICLPGGGEIEVGEPFPTGLAIVKIESREEEAEGTLPSEEPVVDCVIKLEPELIRETRHRKIYQNNEVLGVLGTVTLMQVGKEAEIVDLDEKSAEGDKSTVSSKVYSPQETGKENKKRKCPGKARKHPSAMLKEERTGEPSRKQRSNSGGNPRTHQNEGAKWLSQVKVSLGKEDVGKYFRRVPKLTPEQFHELVVNLKKENRIDLLGAGAWLKSKTRKFEAAFHQVIEKGSVLKKTLDILSKAGMDFNLLSSGGCNALAFAIKGKRNISLMRKLINRGASVNVVDFKGRNLLHYAAMAGRKPEVLKYLIKKGVQLRQEDHSGDTPFSKVIKVKNIRRKMELVDVLLNAPPGVDL